MDENPKNTFTAKIEIIGINPFVFLPKKILKDIFQVAGKDKGPIPVRGKINDKPFRQTLVKYSGEWRLYINTVMLKDSPKRIGERINLSVEFDLSDRSIPMPAKFQTALRQNPEAKKSFKELSPSRQKEIIRYINNLKSKEAIERNISRAIQFLSGNGGFVGRPSL